MGDLGSIPGLNIPWRRGRLSTPVFWPEEFHGLYSPWGHKESDTTKRLALHDGKKVRLRHWGLEGEFLLHVSWSFECFADLTPVSLTVKLETVASAWDGWF